MAILHLVYGIILLLAPVSFALMVMGLGGEIFGGFAVGFDRSALVLFFALVAAYFFQPRVKRAFELQQNP